MVVVSAKSDTDTAIATSMGRPSSRKRGGEQVARGSPPYPSAGARRHRQPENGDADPITPPLLLAVGNRSSRWEWQHGVCRTDPGQPDNRTGSWTGLKASECLQRCQRHLPCWYVSYSPEEGGDCSWFRNCDLNALEPVRTGHATRAVHRTRPVYMGFPLGACASDRGCSAAMRASTRVDEPVHGLTKAHAQALRCKTGRGLLVVVLGSTSPCRVPSLGSGTHPSTRLPLFSPSPPTRLRLRVHITYSPPIAFFVLLYRLKH